MVQSLLPAAAPHHAALRAALGPAAEAVARLWPEWPVGFGPSRLVSEYLLGRSRGWLDISGRPAAEVSDGPSAAPAADPAWVQRPLVVIDDEDGTLLLAGSFGGAEVRAYWDDLRNQRRSLAAAAELAAAGMESLTRGMEPLASGMASAPEAHLSTLPRRALFPPGCRVVLAAPKANAALREYLQAAAGAAAEVIVVGREKHMSPSINAELAEVFERVDVSPGLAKCRLIIGSGPRDRAAETPETGAAHRGETGAAHRGETNAADTGEAGAAPVLPRTDARPLRVPGAAPVQVAAYGACYGGTQIDRGTDALIGSLLEHRDELTAAAPHSAVARPGAAPEAADPTVVDLGCGNGWLLANVRALLNPATSIGVDVSKAALASAAETLGAHAGGTAAGLQLLLADAADASEPALAPLSGSADLVVVNPPFHAGHTIETATAHAMIGTAHRLLRLGGRLVCVYNSHLGYRAAINRTFGGSRQWARDRRFTVVTAQRRT